MKVGAAARSMHSLRIDPKASLSASQDRETTMTQIALMVGLGVVIELFFVCDVIVHRHRRGVRD